MEAAIRGAQATLRVPDDLGLGGARHRRQQGQELGNGRQQLRSGLRVARVVDGLAAAAVA